MADESYEGYNYNAVCYSVDIGADSTSYPCSMLCLGMENTFLFILNSSSLYSTPLD